MDVMTADDYTKFVVVSSTTISILDVFAATDDDDLKLSQTPFNQNCILGILSSVCM